MLICERYMNRFEIRGHVHFAKDYSTMCWMLACDIVSRKVTAEESDDFVTEVIGDANRYGLANVCVARYGRVVYATGSQEMIQWPAMEWLLATSPSWHHYVLMCAQTLPFIGVGALRSILRSNR